MRSPSMPPRRVLARRTQALVLMAAFLGVLVYLSGSRSQPAETGQLEFSATTVDGARFSGQSLAGKPVVLWFWTPWCPACAGEASTVVRAARDHPEITFVGVAALGEVPAMREFVARHGMTGMTHLADLDSSVWRRFHVISQPTFAFLSADGSMQLLKGVSERDLATSLDLLAGR